MKDESKNILSFLFIVLFIFFIFIVCVNSNLISTLNENRDYLQVKVGIGDSMKPFAESGDVLVILSKESPHSKITVGDIIVFEYESTYIAHRVITIMDDHYYVKGDNVEMPDGFISEDQIIGEVIEIVGKDDFIGKAIISSYR